MRIAVCFCGDSSDPVAWSGSPAGLTKALDDAGHTVLRVNAGLPDGLARLANRIPQLHPERCVLHSRIAASRLAGLEYDAVVQIGSEYTIDTNRPTVTYEDMTVVQHVRINDHWFNTFPRRGQEAWRKRQAHSYANADRCCVFSRWAGDSIVEDYGQPEDKVRVIGLGGNHVIEPPTDRDWSRPRYLIVAKDWRHKNVPLVIETFSRVRDVHPDATLDVVGPYDLAPPPGVTLHGDRDLRVPADRRTVEGLFRVATCYVMPSKHEGAGLVFVEAGSAGIPSIGTAIGGARDVIGPGGTVVDPKDTAVLLDEMLRMADPSEARRLGALAAEHARWYTWPATAERLIKVIEEI
jgi:glycosyltransferase involved in cell wall biosynthesis